MQIRDVSGSLAVPLCLVRLTGENYCLYRETRTPKKRQDVQILSQPQSDVALGKRL